MHKVPRRDSLPCCPVFIGDNVLTFTSTATGIQDLVRSESITQCHQCPALCWRINVKFCKSCLLCEIQSYSGQSAPKSPPCSRQPPLGKGQLFRRSVTQGTCPIHTGCEHANLLPLMLLAFSANIPFATAGSICVCALRRVTSRPVWIGPQRSPCCV